MSQADIFRISLLKAGEGMGEAEIIAPPMQDRVNECLDEFRYRLEDRKSRMAEAVLPVVNSALQGEYGSEAVEKLASDHPDIWEQVCENKELLMSQIEASDETLELNKGENEDDGFLPQYEFDSEKSESSS
jgi:hypothetical protein